MYHEIQSVSDFDLFIKENQAVLAYFSTDACNVCKVLKPKVDELVQADFPQMKLVYVKSDHSPELAAKHTVFVAPTILVFFHGKEYIRKSRSISLPELRKEIKRPYTLAL